MRCRPPRAKLLCQLASSCARKAGARARQFCCFFSLFGSSTIQLLLRRATTLDDSTGSGAPRHACYERGSAAGATHAPAR